MCKTIFIKRTIFTSLVFFFASFFISAFAQPAILVFSKTNGYRHKSIEAGMAAFKKMAAEKNFVVEFTEDSLQFNTANLNRFKAVVFLNTTGNVLGDAEQAAFEKYIQSGRGTYRKDRGKNDFIGGKWEDKVGGRFFLAKKHVALLTVHIHYSLLPTTAHNPATVNNLPDPNLRSGSPLLRRRGFGGYRPIAYCNPAYT